jgi:UDP-3-O-[3-hydroxymyristoyl] glucosamine N-acyltransferase
MPGPGLTVGEIAGSIERGSAGALSATIHGDGSRRILAVATLEAAGQDDLAFLANPRYHAAARASAAGALVLTPAQSAALFPDGRDRGVVLACEQPYAWFACAAQLLHPEPVPRAARDASAIIAPDANVDATSRIDAHAVVASEATVGAGAWIGAGAFVGAGAQIGPHSRLHAGAIVQAGCRIGARCILHSASVVGADGFGFAPFQGRWIKIPQVGRALLGDDVEVGAGSTIDRGTMGDTIVEDGVKIDNQVQIAHNCRIGAHTVIAGCAGIAGSAIIGRNCQIGGAAMIAGHLSIADGTLIGGGTLVSKTIREAGFYTAVFPLMTNRDWERNAALVRHLDELRDRVRRLERELAPARRTERGE